MWGVSIGEEIFQEGRELQTKKKEHSKGRNKLEEKIISANIKRRNINKGNKNKRYKIV